MSKQTLNIDNKIVVNYLNNLWSCSKKEYDFPSPTSNKIVSEAENILIKPMEEPNENDSENHLIQTLLSFHYLK